MPTRLSKSSVIRAVDHLIRYGDTDVFPLSLENVFIADMRDDVVSSVAEIDLETFSPSQAVETIAPKSRYGFRIVHQLPILETILFTASTVEIVKWSRLSEQIFRIDK
jgi:hypothetical protein